MRAVESWQTGDSRRQPSSVPAQKRALPFLSSSSDKVRLLFGGAATVVVRARARREYSFDSRSTGAGRLHIVPLNTHQLAAGATPRPYDPQFPCPLAASSTVAGFSFTSSRRPRHSPPCKHRTTRLSSGPGVVAHRNRYSSTRRPSLDLSPSCT